MRKQLHIYATIAVLFSLLLMACKTGQKTSQTSTIKKDEGPCCIGNYTEYNYVPLIDLGIEFKRLKALQDDCCEKHNSALAMLMKSLGKELGQIGTSKAKIIEVMGKADLEQNNKLYYYLGESKEGLLFEFKDQKLSKYRWLKAT